MTNIKKFISILLVIFLISGSCFAGPIDIINEIRNRTSEKGTTSNELILNALNKNKSTEVKIIEEKKEVKEITQIKEKNKDVLLGIDIG